MRARWSVRIAGAAVLAGALALIPHALTRTDAYVRYQKMTERVGELERGNAELRRKNQLLRREIRRLHTDVDAVEDVARDELGLVKPGEIVIQLEQKPRIEDVP